MLSDAQIERYCRQIVLPELGSRGQERLLRSTASISGGGDAALLCGLYLAGAGLGRIAILRGRASPASIAAGDLAGRNPDCTILDGPAESSDVTIWIGAPPGRFPPRDAVVLWGAAAGPALTLVRFAHGRACAACLRRAAPTAGPPPAAAAELLAGALLAAAALRAVLGLGGAGSEMLRADLERASFETLPFPHRASCPQCAGG